MGEVSFLAGGGSLKDFRIAERIHASLPKNEVEKSLVEKVEEIFRGPGGQESFLAYCILDLPFSSDEPERWRSWSPHHGTFNASRDKFESDFLPYASGCPVICIEIKGRNHKYWIYLRGEDPEKALKLLIISEVLLS